MKKNMDAGGGGDKQPPPPQKKSLIMIPPPDEERCCRTDGVSWRCTNFRMNLSVFKDDGLDTKYCENHYNSIKEQHKNQQTQQKKHKKKNKKKSSIEDADDSSSSGTETWDSTYMEWKKVKFHRKGIRPAPPTNDITSDIEGGSANIETKKKKVERFGELDFLIEKPCLDKEMEKNMELPPDEDRCTQGKGYKYRCKNFRMGHGVAAADDTVPKTSFCEKHYNYYANYYQLPPEEQRCCHTRGEHWRCKNYRMSFGADDDDGSVPRFCEKHYYNYPANYNHLPPDEERCCHTRGEHWRCKNYRMSHGAAADDDSVPKTRFCEKHSNYSANYNQLPPDAQRCCYTRGNHWRCKNFRMGHGAAVDDDSDPKTRFCEKHYNYFANYNQMLLPPDEERCTQTSGGGKLRCMKFRMGLSAAAADNHSVPKSKHCEKHFNSRIKAYQKYVKKIRAINPIECRESKKRRRKVTEEDDVTPDTSADTIIGDGTSTTANIIKRKRENVERTEGCRELELLTTTLEPAVKSKSTLERYKTKCIELSLELENKKVECTKLQAQLLEVLQTKKSYATDLKTREIGAKDGSEWVPEDAAEYWREMLSDLKSRVLRIENENSTVKCIESRVSNLESLVLRNGKGNSETIESEAQGLLNDVCENQGDKNYMIKPNAETSRRSNKDSHLYELKTGERVLKNVYDTGTSENHELQSEFRQHSAVYISSGDETPSKTHLKMSDKPFMKFLSDDGGESFGEFIEEDFYTSTDSNGFLGNHMDMLAMKHRNRKEDEEIKWKFEADMLSSLEEDPQLCMKAVCALYRQEISDDAKALFHYSDALRGTTLAKFLMDGACTGDLKKSIKELETLDSKAVEDCKRLARSYSKQLFSIYQNKKDPYFLPTTTSIHGDRTT